MTLADVTGRESVRITTIDAGFGLRRRLGSMGLHAGDVVTVVSRAAFRGPLLVQAHGVRLALGRGVAGRIGVIPVTCPSRSPAT
ncbi:MAG: FeoA family protein [Candidatus Bipolaricaulota bacterium]